MTRGRLQRAARVIALPLITGLAPLLNPLAALACDEAPAKKPAVRIETERLKPPSRAVLPEAGMHPAEKILSIAGILSGRTVRIESERARATRVAITKEIAGHEVSLEELALLLAAHKLYLFEHTDPKEGDLLIASKNPAWRDEPPRHTRVIDVGEGSFRAAWERVERAVAERNADLPKGSEPEVFAVPDERTGKIFVGATSARALAQIDKTLALSEGKEKNDPDRPRLYTYVGNFRPVRELEAALREKLSDGELNRIRIVVGSRGNRLYFRAPAGLWDKLKGLLESLDRRPGSAARTVPAPKGEKQPAGDAARPPAPRPGGAG
ncbi:MAG TPA: hypothetical protein VMT52_16625 [Planctomycetota bacterium]|nr:hypothetical protein [Planctomycetota bacterium]